MRYARGISAILAFVMLFSCMNLFVFATEESPSDASVNYNCHTLDAVTTYLGSTQITKNIGTAVVYEINSDTLMYALNADEKVYPSSLVKILTALIAVEKGDLQEQIIVSQDVLDTVPYYAASAELVADEQITLSDLLYCMMVGSANDAAAVIATHLSGTQENFVHEMNAYAQKLGCTGTQFVNVHGLHDDQQYSTARDLAKIVTSAVENEAFLEYFSAVHYEVPATNKSEKRELASGNFLMNPDNIQIYYDERAQGGRTGIAEDGLHCLATLAEQGSMRLVCIVTGSESTFAENGTNLTYGSFKETSALLDSAFNGYHVVQVLHENQTLQQFEVLNGENDVVLGSSASAYSVLPADISVSELSYQFHNLSDMPVAPIEAGAVLSSVSVWYGSLCVGQANLVAMNNVREIVAQQQIDTQDEDKNNPGPAAFIIIGVLVAALAIFVLMKFSGEIGMYFAKKHKAAQRRDRRRSR